MAVAGIVVQASPGLIGFDVTNALTLAEARLYFAKNFRFCVRYVSRDDASRDANQRRGTPDLSEAETDAILMSGMALMAVQHVAMRGWMPSAELGKAYGENAATYASDAGLMEGVTLWLDLEGIAEGTDHQAIIDYCNAWFVAVSSGGYEPGVYVGFDVWLSPDELYFDLKTKHYWRADGHIPDISHRGYQMFQNTSNPGTPNEFDRNVTNNDNFGGAVTWMIGDGVPIA